MFEELFEHLLNYEAQLQLSVSSASPATTPTTALVTSIDPSSHCRSHNCGVRNHNQSQQSKAIPDIQLKHYRLVPLTQLGHNRYLRHPPPLSLQHPPPLSPRHPAPPPQLGHNRYLGRCQICGITGHFARQ